MAKREKRKRWTDEDEARLRAWMMNQDGELKEKGYASLVRLAMQSPAFRKSLLKDPQKALRQAKLKPGKVKVKVVENTAKVAYLVLPSAKPKRSKEKIELVDGDMKSGSTVLAWRFLKDDFDHGDFTLPGIGAPNDNNKGDPGGKD